MAAEAFRRDVALSDRKTTPGLVDQTLAFFFFFGAKMAETFVMRRMARFLHR